MRKGIDIEDLKPLVDAGLKNRDVMKILGRTKGSIRAAMLKYGLKFERDPWTKEKWKKYNFEYNKKYYKENKEKVLKNNRKNRSTLVEYLREYKRNNPCIICGECNIVCIDLHHVDPSVKEHNLGQITRLGSLNTIKEELKKTVSLCSNCHRKLHFDSDGEGKVIIDYVTQNFSQCFRVKEG